MSESPATRNEEAVKRGHNRRKQEKIQEKDITGLKYFDKLNPLLERLHEEGCERDTAGNRQLHFDQYCMLILLYLFNPIVVASALVIGGVLILWAERRKHVISTPTVDDLNWRRALAVGFAQALAMVPGTSRSGATIIGGLFLGLSRKAAAEFSFLLAIPTMLAATAYDLYKNWQLFDAGDIPLFVVGGTASFVSALIAVRTLLKFVSRHDYTLFAWYRIVFGGVVLATAYSGLVDWGVAV